MASVVLAGGSGEERLALRRALSPEPRLEVLGEVEGAAATVRLLGRLRPDLLLLVLGARADLDLVGEVMHAAPRPIVAVASAHADPSLAYRAPSLGALEVLPPLPPAGSPGYEARRAQLAHLLGVLASVPVVTRSQSRPLPAPASPTPHEAPPRLSPAPSRRPRPWLIAIGASTGGPPVLEAILRSLPAGFSTPIAVVQHLTPGFRGYFASWLAESCLRELTVVDHATKLVPRGIYLAADDLHLALVAPDALAPRPGEPRCFQRPAVDVLFESAAELLGPRAVGVLLTGMGSDGVAGMAALRARGCLTIAQTPSTCAVESMPRGAIERGAAEVEAAPEEIARVLVEACERG